MDSSGAAPLKATRKTQDKKTWAAAATFGLFVALCLCLVLVLRHKPQNDVREQALAVSDSNFSSTSTSVAAYGEALVD